MKLPNGDRALVPLEKLSEYSLNLANARGKHKARVFRAALGWTVENAGELRELLLERAQEAEVETGQHNGYGQIYRLDFTIPGPDGEVTIRSNWIIRDGEDFPRLTTCFVKDGGKRQ